MLTRRSSGTLNRTRSLKACKLDLVLSSYQRKYFLPSLKGNVVVPEVGSLKEQCQGVRSPVSAQNVHFLAGGLGTLTLALMTCFLIYEMRRGCVSADSRGGYRVWSRKHLWNTQWATWIAFTEGAPRCHPEVDAAWAGVIGWATPSHIHMLKCCPQNVIILGNKICNVV